MVKPFAFR